MRPCLPDGNVTWMLTSLTAAVPGQASQLALGAGPQWKLDRATPVRIRLQLTGEYARGSTEFGLATTRYRAGPRFEVTFFHRLAFGVGADLALFAIQRRTTGEILDYPSLGAYALASIDVVRIGPTALFVSARANADGPSADAAQMSISLSAGLRF